MGSLSCLHLLGGQRLAYWRGWDALRLPGERVVVGQNVNSDVTSYDMIEQTRDLFF